MKMEYSESVFKEERWPPKFVRHGQVYINLGNVFAECVHFVNKCADWSRTKSPLALRHSFWGRLEIIEY